MCQFHDVEVVIVTETEDQTYEEELVQDVRSIVTVLSARLYGSRSHKIKQWLIQPMDCSSRNPMAKKTVKQYNLEPLSAHQTSQFQVI